MSARISAAERKLVSRTSCALAFLLLVRPACSANARREGVANEHRRFWGGSAARRARGRPSAWSAPNATASRAFGARRILLVTASPWRSLLATDYVLSAILVPFLALSLAAIGQNLITGYAGQLSVGSAAFMSVGAFAAYDVTCTFAVTPLLVTLRSAGLVAGLAGALFGLPSLAHPRLLPRGLDARRAVLRRVALHQGRLVLRRQRVRGRSPRPRSSSPGSIFLAGRSLLALAPRRRAAHAPRTQPGKRRVGRGGWRFATWRSAAAVVGVPTRRAKLLAFAVGSFYCGIAGSSSRSPISGPSSRMAWISDRSFQILFIVILGGLGSIAGPFLGAAFVILFPVALDYSAIGGIRGSADPSLLQNIEKILFGSPRHPLPREATGRSRALHSSIAWTGGALHGLT